MLRRLDVERLVDAPCGDLNWISKTDLSGIHYVGIDCDSAHLAIAGTRSTGFARSVCLIEADIIRDPFPFGDAILVRDFFQHISIAAVWDVLRGFCRSGARWLLATTYEVEVNEEVPFFGGFRPLNLSAAPFLMAPAFNIADPPKTIGVWSRKVVKQSFSEP